MEHIVQEGINTKKKQQSGGIFEDLMKTLSKQEKQKSCPINLFGKGVDIVPDYSIVLFLTLWRQVFSRFLRQEEQIGYTKLN